MTEAIHPAALATMRERGGNWAAYRDAEIETRGRTRPLLKFLKFGPDCTYESRDTLPPHYPHPTISGGVVYRLAGVVNLTTGEIER